MGSCWVKEGLAENEYLEKFDISWNHFQSKGCMALAEGIKVGELPFKMTTIYYLLYYITLMRTIIIIMHIITH